MPISSSTSPAGQMIRYLKRRSVKRPSRSPNPRATVVAMASSKAHERRGRGITPKGHAQRCRRGPIGSVRIGVGLACPVGVSLALGVDADLLGGLVPLRGDVV